MKKALHIFAVNGKTNSGDFFLGPATKWKFESIVGNQVVWSDFDVRRLVTENDINYFNSFDYIVVGGGGLLLPDTNPNMISCWQWAISKNLIKSITSKIYVLGLGWNLFYGQTVMMPHRDKDDEVYERKQIFKENLETLIMKSEIFSMRHIGDCDRLKELVDKKVHNNIEFNLCPVVGYVESRYKPTFTNKNVFHTFEIKDDRPNRRYHKKPRNTFYEELYRYIKKLSDRGEHIAVMSHDGSSSFIQFLAQRQIGFTIINNTIANEEKIIDNYSQVKKLYCTAGHSQMMAYALGIKFYSLLTHDKLKYFLQDVGEFEDKNYCLVNEENICG